MGIIGDETLEIRCMIGPPLPSHIHFSYTQWALMGRGELRIFLKPLHSPVTFPQLQIFLTDTQTIALCRLSPTLLLCRCAAAGRAGSTGPAHVLTSLSIRNKAQPACVQVCVLTPAPHATFSSPAQQMKWGHGRMPSVLPVGSSGGSQG